MGKKSHHKLKMKDFSMNTCSLSLQDGLMKDKSSFTEVGMHHLPAYTPASLLGTPVPLLVNANI